MGYPSKVGQAGPGGQVVGREGVPGDCDSSNPLLQVNDLRTSFFTKRGVVRAVDGVNLTIPQGATVGLVGESGCGKSIAAFSIMGLVGEPGRVEDGTVLYRGQDLLSLSSDERRALSGDRISIIFQEPMTSLDPVEQVGKQVAEALLTHKKVATKAQAKERVLEMFRQVGIPDPQRRYKSYPHQLSGGLRQRVMIALAMCCDPDLLIADEPTTALDVTIEAQILHLMRRLQQEHGTSILLISHNLGVIAEICDYVYVMYAGVIVEAAEVHELFKSPLHPYTQGLLAALPSIRGNQRRLNVIRGMVPDLLDMPEGCRFGPRCDMTCERCHAKEPALVEVMPGHWVRCWQHVGAGAADGDIVAKCNGEGE